MESEKTVGYWKARAEALEAANRRLHERLLRLVASLPPEYLDLFDENDGGAPRAARDLRPPSGENSDLTPAAVEGDLSRLWERTAPPRGD